ncbi:hypothetical protein F0562_032712 [Nyssa sinensis]|uniref:non-specific serine/threonine protein kinase n=1 Tax=Nyssa sinensis TaxID=561372 RepID=A0A5J5AQW1_9ASTE|nr:hypothetical protein F0562_032712 [Nyssa sinensis]
MEKGGEWFNVSQISQAYTITIHDHIFAGHLQSRSCESFNNFTYLNSPSLSFKIRQNSTFFKCKNRGPSPYLDNQFVDYLNYPCGDDIIYYNFSKDSQSLLSGSLPHQCSVIQLPVNLSNKLFTSSPPPLNQCQDISKEEFQCAGLKKGTGMHLLIKAAIAASTAGIGVLIIILALCFRRKFSSGESMGFWKKKTENYRDIEAFLRNCGSLAPKRYSYADVKKMTYSFKRKLGQGGYGCVYKGKLHNGSVVAVKVLNESKGSGEEFINEVASISRTSHVNIVTLLGFCFEGLKRALIYEFLPNGSLEKFIYDCNSMTNCQLGWETLYQIAVGIAQGLEYLHRGCNTQILHFDIKPHNILLDEDFSPKISDFGLAKLCLRKESVVSMVGARGTVGYIAPEVCCRSFGGVSHKSDVYSYGMMILEMVGGRKNVNAQADRTSEIYFPHWIHKRLELGQELGLHGIINDEQKESARKMIIVGLWCIQINPSDRPPMSRVVAILKGSLETLHIPPAPFLSSPVRSPTDSSTTLVA